MITHEKAAQLLERLKPEILRGNLAKAGLYILAYEALEDFLIDKPQQFLCDLNQNGALRRGQDYKTDVKSLNKDILIASCLWFEKMGAISSAEIAKVIGFRVYRNKLAHEMPNILFETEETIDEQGLVDIAALIRKTSSWWMTEVENLPSTGESLAAMLIDYLITITFSTGSVQ